MQLSLQTDYALRTLMALAAAKRQLTVDDIARRYVISRNHLAKVVQRLQAEGYVETIRGRGGGIVLARPANSITVGEIVRRLENFDAFVGCFAGGSGCAVEGLCALKPALSGALDEFLAHLDRFTVENLVPDIPAFLRRLQADSEAAA